VDSTEDAEAIEVITVLSCGSPCSSDDWYRVTEEISVYLDIPVSDVHIHVIANTEQGSVVGLLFVIIDGLVRFVETESRQDFWSPIEFLSQIRPK
jgi:hypothetical protein